jgi:hypothetical protein
MRKQELVQLHALCSQVRRYVERRYDLPEGAFDRYDRADVPPMAIHRKKAVHEDALDRLLSDLRTAIATHSEGPSGSSSEAAASSAPAFSEGSSPEAAEADRLHSQDDVLGRRE